MAEPQQWRTDKTTGIEYRRATSNEIAKNGWSPGAYLLHYPQLAGFEEPAPAVITLMIPVSDDDTTVLDASLTATDIGPQFTGISRAGDRASDTQMPVFNRYAAYRPAEGESTSGEHVVTAVLTASAEGGVHGRALVGDVEAELFGPEEWWAIDVLPPHIEQVPHDELVLVQLWARTSRELLVPSDANTAADNNRVAYWFGIFGEAKWCDAHSNNWQTLVSDIASEIEAGFDNLPVMDADPNFEYAHCWFDSDLDDTPAACDANGGCVHSGHSHSYPYNSADESALGYRDQAWADVDHARQHVWFGGLDIVHVLHDGLLVGSSGEALCGLSKFPPDAGESVAAGPSLPSGCLPYLSTHEVGHSFEAIHSKATYNSPCWTVMAQSTVTCRENAFSFGNSDRITDCVYLDLYCPRQNAR